MNLRSFGLALCLSLFPVLEVEAQQIYAPPLVEPLLHLQPAQVKKLLRPRFTVLPAKQFDAARAETQAAAAATVPLWSRTVKGYTYEMVGGNPFIALSQPSTTIHVVVVPMRLTFVSFGNAVFDPTANDSTCLSSHNAQGLVHSSPIFNPITFAPGDTSVGTGGYIDLFQRSNYYSQTNPNGLNPNYHVNLTYYASPTITVNVQGGDVVAGVCGNLAMMDFATWDNYLQTQIFPLLATQSPPISPPNTLTVFLLYNTVLYESSTSNCCILGYHSAFNDPNYGNVFHTYANVEFDSNQSFTGVSDISAMSHEVAEWMDDPAGNNPTPSWGNIGQVSGCQANLEVGDPLSGTLNQIYMAKNFYTYHVQDLAFTSWFYGQKPSTGVNGWYSLYGTFLKPAAPC